MAMILTVGNVITQTFYNYYDLSGSHLSRVCRANYRTSVVIKYVIFFTA